MSRLKVLSAISVGVFIYFQSGWGGPVKPCGGEVTAAEREGLPAESPVVRPEQTGGYI